MNFKIFTKQVLALGVVLGFAASTTQVKAQSKRSGAGMIESAFLQKATTSGRQLIPVKPVRNQVTHPGKLERINKAPGDTLFFQDFNGTNWPANMPRVNRDGRTPANATWMGNNAWVINQGVGGVAGRYACSTSWYAPAGQADDWMITPEITLTDNNLLTWKSQAFEAAYADGYEVRMCTNCPATFNNNNVLTSFTTVLFSVAEDQAVAFENHEVDLGTYSGQTVRFAFRNNSNDMNLLFVDDIMVSRQASLDIAAGLIFSPSNSIYNCSRASFPAVASISNKGGNTGYNIAVKLKSVGPISDSVMVMIDSLEKGKSDTIVFPAGLNMSTVGTYNLILTAVTDGDEIPANNTSIGSYLHRAPESAPFSTNFDGLSTDSVLPQEWFCSSRFLPFNNEAGFNGSTSIELPVFINQGTLGTQSTCRLVTAKYTGIPSGSYLTFKYKVVTVAGVEYPLAAGDSIFANVYKDCQLVGAAVTITSDNHQPTTAYRKMFAALNTLGITPTDNVSFEFFVKAASTTTIYLVELDDFNIGSAPSNDVAMVDLEKIPFSQWKRLHLTNPLRIRGSVFNEGMNDLSPVRIEANVLPVGLQDTARVSNLPSGTARSFTTNPGINITNDGEFIFDVNASSPGVTDPNPADNNLNFTLAVSDSVMAKDFGDPFDNAFMQYGPAGTGLRVMANAIKTSLRDTMTSVSVYVGPLAETCIVKAFFANKNTQGNWVIDSSSIAVTLTPDDGDQWVPLRWWKATPTVNQKGKPVAINSENLYGVKIRSGNLRVGFNMENATNDGSFIYLGGQLLGTQDITLGQFRGPFGLFIRANFGRSTTILTSLTQMEHSLQNAEIVPNPAHGNAHLLFNTRDGGEVGIQLFSLNGQLVGETTQMAFKGTNRLEIPVKGIAKGMYLVRINANGFNATKKIILE